MKRVVLLLPILLLAGCQTMSDAKAQGIHYDPGEIARGIRRAFPHHRAPDPRDRKN